MTAKTPHHPGAFEGIEEHEVLTSGNVGLCSTCNNAPSCVHFSARGPALFCELFDDWSEQAAESSGGSSLRGGVDTFLEEATPNPFKGLCMNCDDREICVNASAGGGVWYCEQYR